jgi:hypothetical protein
MPTGIDGVCVCVCGMHAPGRLARPRRIPWVSTDLSAAGLCRAGDGGADPRRARRAGATAAGAASVASFLAAAVLTGIYPCSVCSCQEILRRNGRDQLLPHNGVVSVGHGAGTWAHAPDFERVAPWLCVRVRARALAWRCLPAIGCHRRQHTSHNEAHALASVAANTSVSVVTCSQAAAYAGGHICILGSWVRVGVWYGGAVGRTPAFGRSRCGEVANASAGSLQRTRCCRAARRLPLRSALTKPAADSAPSRRRRVFSGVGLCAGADVRG